MLEQIKQINSLEELQALYSATFGKNGAMTARLKEMKNLEADARAALNQENAELREAFKSRQIEIEDTALSQSLARQRLDADAAVSPRAEPRMPGRLHPLSRNFAETSAVLSGMGYKYYSGPEIEDDWHNFTALNTPEYHPARGMLDTFFLEGGDMPRGQTSAVQIRAMEADGAPIKMFVIGRVYRRDLDATHIPSFSQIEMLWIDKDINLSDLVSEFGLFLKKSFGREFNMRIRPSFFPFTEPSLEVDIEWQPGKWLELGGAGMVHPNVLRNAGVDPNEYQGFALGFGFDRLAMMKYGLTDLREFFRGDVRWLRANGFNAE